MSNINASLLGLLSGASTAGGALVQNLYGSTQFSDPLAALRLAEKNKIRDIASTEKQPEVKRDIDRFKLAISKAKTPDDLFRDPSFVKVLLTANGLGDQVAYTGLAKRALLTNGEDPAALVNKLLNPHWKTLNKLFDFANKGLTAISDPKVQATLADGYAEVQWRQNLNKTTPGLSDALTFRAQAGAVTSVLQILGDAVLRRMVTTALDVPQQIAFQPLETQERAISTRLDVTKLKDPKFIDSFSQRYLLAVRTADARNAGLLV